MGGISERFWAKVEKRNDGCWIWTGARTKGHGSFRLGGRGTKTILAHRFAYETCIGPIPEGRDIHHLCEVQLCVNPYHLVAITRAWHASQHRQERCKRGHLMDEANAYRYPNGGRRCRKCHAMRQRGYSAR